MPITGGGVVDPPAAAAISKRSSEKANSFRVGVGWLEKEVCVDGQMTLMGKKGKMNPQSKL